MPKYPDITRTIKTTVATVLFVNLETTDTYTEEVVLPGTYKTNDAILKAISAHDNETAKAVMIKSAIVNETLYGMSYADFMKYGEVYEPRTHKNSEA